jgi:hypothetical protein
MVTGTDSSFTRHSMREVVHGDSPDWILGAHRHDSTADRYFGERHAPNPVFNSGTPESTPHEVLRSFQTKYEPIGTAREAEAINYAAINHAVW